MHFTAPDEPPATYMYDPSAVHPLAWDSKREMFELSKTVAKEELTRTLGQVLYLQNLEKV